MSSSILFIGGFGGSKYYSHQMCCELQRLACCKVHNIPLHHGYTLEEECNYALDYLGKCDRPILMGFSTGCVVAIELANRIHPSRVILINPAEVLTRMNGNVAKSMIADIHRYHNIATYMQVWKSSFFQTLLWKGLWCVVDSVWWIGCKCIGSYWMAQLYYHYVGKHVNEPRPDELNRCLFQHPFSHLRKTIVECLIKPSLHEKIQKYPGKIDVLVGMEDFTYAPYVRLLCDRYKHILLHRMSGDHHMIYHHPRLTAYRVYGLI